MLFALETTADWAGTITAGLVTLGIIAAVYDRVTERRAKAAEKAAEKAERDEVARLAQENAAKVQAAANKAAASADKAASKADEVKADLKESTVANQEASDRKEGKIDSMAGAVDTVVKQTNNISAVHLAETLAAYKELLSVKHTPENVARVDKAQEAYDRHVENQARADAPKPP